MKERIDKFMRHPVVAHIMAAVERYNRRLGPQFAAAVTYFSVLSLVPILLFAFAMLGMTLTVLRPDLLDVVKEMIYTSLGAEPGADPDDGSVAQTIVGVIDEALANWRGITVLALLTAAYSGTKWVGNLKKAFRAMWRDRFAEASQTRNFILEMVENLFIFLGLLFSIALAFGVTNAGGTFSETVIGWLGWEHISGIEVLLRVGSIVLVLVASWLLFAFLFVVLPGQSAPWRIWLVGTVVGAVLVTALQQAAGLVFGIFSGNRAASIFGPVIVLMLVLNILATIILMIAAWVGTEDTWQDWLAAKDRDRESGTKRGDEDPEGSEESEGSEEPAVLTVPPQPASRWAARKHLDELRAVNYDPEQPPEPSEAPDVPQDVAARSVRVGMGLGWGVGAATGVGLGAAIAALVGWIVRR